MSRKSTSERRHTEDVIVFAIASTTPITLSFGVEFLKPPLQVKETTLDAGDKDDNFRF